MSPPEEEASEDDPSISDDDNLLRRVPNVPHMVAAQSDGTIRVTSAALIRRGERGCSVSVQSRLHNPEEPLDVLADFPETWGLVATPAGTARNQGERRVVGRPEDGNRAHAEVIPNATSRKEQKRSLKALAEQMIFVCEPTLGGRNAGRDE